jgi:hypothetical protein
MTKKEFDAIVDDAVENGADRKQAEAYVRSGFHINEDAEGQESLKSKQVKGKKAKSKK